MYVDAEVRSGISFLCVGCFCALRMHGRAVGGRCVMRNEGKRFLRSFTLFLTPFQACVSEFDEPKGSHGVHIPDYDIPTEIPRKHKNKNREPEAWVLVRM